MRHSSLRCLSVGGRSSRTYADVRDKNQKRREQSEEEEHKVAGSVNYEYLIKELLTEPVAQTLDLPKIAADYNSSLDTLRGLAQGVEL